MISTYIEAQADVGSVRAAAMADWIVETVLTLKLGHVVAGSAATGAHWAVRPYAGLKPLAGLFSSVKTGWQHRPGVYQCNQCREQFTVTVKTVFERSKIPLSKWLARIAVMDVLNEQR